ncbi:MAG TPA: signal recognition particle-docking protein FtsY [Candidatus Diapherotrites archaeon]|uniref:Signal recognition particle receptor FtsY n=1 Tax=Candidatus Iainarchaeum sp. TaxID=3101447 RepID=A0A7J4IZJ0_9ARCH|nr:signal recognition particle-docking protein FtsY [Candidatus Diapherotrites archaeon]
MFDFLKKKISAFTEKVKETLQGKGSEGKPQEDSPQAAEHQVARQKEQNETQTFQESKTEVPEKQILQKAAEKEIPAKKARGEIAENKGEKSGPEKEIQGLKKKGEEKGALGRQKTAPEIKKGIRPPKLPAQATAPLPQAGPANPAQQTRGEEKALAQTGDKPDIERPQTNAQKQHGIDIAGEDRMPIEKIREVRGGEKRELKAKTGILTKLGGILGGKIKISGKDTQEFFDELELSLLESDVELDAAQAIVAELRSRLVGKEIAANGDVSGFLKSEVKASLAAVMGSAHIDLLEIRKKPVKILFLGPNGAGKTTTIAKVANYLMSNGKSVILAAGDTFRAASIEQLETHANALGVKVVKHNYGSDPAAVAFDAVKAAQAKGIDFVLIDTAGRQETNTNLLEELKKIERVIKPDVKIYVGEAYTGQALLQQAGEFDKAIGIDGFVLTKIDTDAKGGTAISLLYALKKPIIFVGTGQRYSDLLEFKPEFIIERVI